jgi:PadR family transcriptional regulator, regulatory protein PadR
MKKGEYLGEFEQIVLLAVLRHNDNAYGVNVWREIEERTGRSVLVGAIYTTLDRLEEKGYVSSYVGAPSAERGGRAKRFYKIEKSGLVALNQSARILKSMWAGLSLEEA